MIIFCALKANAQINSKTNLSELNQDQLNLTLKKSSENMLVGKIFIGVGIGLVIPGIVMSLSGQSNNDIGPSPETARGLDFLGGGLLFELIGIPTVIKESHRKTKIEIELAKFNTKGSASINGIGLKIRF